MGLRQYPRAATCLPVQARADGRPLGHTRDIGAGGMFLTCSEKVRVGERVELTIIDGDQRVDVTGLATRCETDGVAMTFANLAATTSDHLQRIVDRQIVSNGPVSERRRRGRTLIEYPVQWWQEGHPKVSGALRNLGIDGALIATTEPASVNDRVYVLLGVDGEEPRECTATVRHVCDNAMGIEFAAPCKDFHATIEQILLAAVDA